MSRLPQSTEYQAVNLTMETLLESDKLSTEDKFLLNSKIQAVHLTHELSARTLANVSEGSTIKRFFVLSVELKDPQVNDKTIKLLASCINQKLLMKLEHDNKAKLAIVSDSVVQNRFVDMSELADDDIFPELRGSDIDTIWANLIADIAQYELASVDSSDKISLFEQLQLNKQCSKLQKDIARLEKKCFAEQQPRRKIELFEKIQAMKKELASLQAKLPHDTQNPL